ncbi:tetratricopeptide repeat protein, partial [Microcoleus sp. S13_B4]|uniref:tetratricopeptide repeat protein n=1 Tax=Microcoleus sp. S13_B4 TaxID=3055408 RepID=UPI002FCF7E5E
KHRTDGTLIISPVSQHFGSFISWITLSGKLLGREIPHYEVTSADSVEGLLKQGLCQFYRGHYQASIDIFHQASEIEPQNPLIWFRLGLACYLLEEYEKAIEHLSQALEIRQSYTLAKALRGWAYNKLNETEKARADFNQARDFQQLISTEHQSYEDWQGQCIALDGLFNIDKLPCAQEALDSYDKAIQLKSDSCEVWLSYGIIQRNLRENERAIGCYDQAIRLQPDYQEAWRRRSIALSQIKEQKKAIVSSEIARAINPDSYKSWCTLGIGLSNLNAQEKDPEKAIKSYDKAIELKANYAKAWYNRGNALINSKHPNRQEEAIKSYQKATEYKPNYADAWYYLGLTQERLDNDPEHYSKALKSYHKAVHYKPDYSKAWYRRGNVLKILNYNKEALESYDRAIELDPNDSLAREERITVLLTLFKAGRHTDVTSSCQRILKIIPYDPETHQILADALMRWDRNNNAPKALNHYAQAIDLGLDSAEVWCGQGKALQELEDYKEAIKSYKKALERDELCWEAYDGYGWTCYKLRKSTQALANWDKGIQALKVASYSDEQERGLGELHYSKSRYYHRQTSQSRQKAKENYQAAIQHFKNTRLLEREVEVWQDLLELYQDLPLTHQLKGELQANLLEGTERYEQLSKKKEKEDFRLEKKFARFNQLSVDTFAKLGYHNEALKVAELRKNLCLSWFAPDKRDADIDSWNYQDIQDILLNEETAAIDWHISPTAITTFILWHKNPPLLIRGSDTSPARQLKDFEKWMAEWKKDYQGYKSIQGTQAINNHSWRKSMRKRLDNLAKILDIFQILKCLAKEGIKQVILIPHRDLHLLPIHVLFYNNYTDTDQDYTITYLPSAQIGVDLKKLKTNSGKLPQDRSMLIVAGSDTAKKLEQNYLPNLLYSELEAAIISQQYKCLPENRIGGKKATRKQVINGLKANYDIFHFTGHGYHDVSEPQNSYLQLANTEKLTMRDISKNFSGFGLKGYNLVALSACETGMSGKSGLIDEFVSLASGFLAVGTTYVISTLWKVNEIPAALLMIQFFQNPKVNSNPPLALKEAQDWLRTLTYAKLAEWYRERSTEQENLVYSQNLKSLAENAQEKSETLAEEEAEKILLVNAIYNLREWNQRFSHPLRHLSP